MAPLRCLLLTLLLPVERNSKCSDECLVVLKNDKPDLWNFHVKSCLGQLEFTVDLVAVPRMTEVLLYPCSQQSIGASLLSGRKRGL